MSANPLIGSREVSAQGRSNSDDVENILVSLVVASRALSLVQLSVSVGYWIPRSSAPAVDAVLLAVVLLSAGVSCGRMLQAGTPQLPTYVAVDVAIGVIALASMPWLIGPAEVTTWGNWAYPVTLFTASAAGVCFSPRAAGVAAGLLAAAYGLEAVHVGPMLDATTLAANAWSYLLFGAAAVFLARLLRRLGRLADEGAEAQAELAAVLAGERVREQVRPLVHAYDNVVAGVTDTRMPMEVRQAYLRDSARLRVRAKAFLQGAETPLVSFVEELSHLADPVGSPMLHVDMDGWTDNLAAPRAHALLDAVEEAVLNARKHAAATTVTVRATSSHQAWSVTITDDGCGPEVPAAWPGPQDPSGHGLVMLLGPQLPRLGIECAISSAAGGGTTVTLSGPR